jgi:hypothetical protein
MTFPRPNCEIFRSACNIMSRVMKNSAAQKLNQTSGVMQSASHKRYARCLCCNIIPRVVELTQKNGDRKISIETLFVLNFRLQTV